MCQLWKGKARQLAVTQANEEHVKATSKEHQVFVDISSVKHRKERRN
jgi:hypothetical protein